MDEEEVGLLYRCEKCSHPNVVYSSMTYWDDKCSGYSRKLYTCPKCGCINVIGYEEDLGLYVNDDDRYYR